MKVWMNGKLVDKRAAKVSVWEHGLLYGDGVFEGIRAYNGRVFHCQAHIDRLYDSAKHIRLAIPFTKQELSDAIVDTLRANGQKDAYIRLVVTRGEGNLGLNPFQCPTPGVFIIADKIELYPQDMYRDGMAVIVAKTLRTSATMLSPAVKSLNYLNNIMGKIEAIDAGVAEAILLNDKGHVAECTGDNLFIVKDGTALTPPPEDGFLIGITRGLVIKLARESSVPLREQTITRADLYTADECFLTGTAAEVIPVTKIDGRAIGTGQPGPVTLKLSTAFRQYIASGNW